MADEKALHVPADKCTCTGDWPRTDAWVTGRVPRNRAERRYARKHKLTTEPIQHRVTYHSPGCLASYYRRANPMPEHAP